MKSDYSFVANNLVIPLPPNSEIGQARVGLKQRIWRLETSSKILMFLWRVISGAWAVADRLQAV